MEVGCEAAHGFVGQRARPRLVHVLSRRYPNRLRPFVAVYLTAHAWAQFDIDLILTAGGLVALAGQMPGGALVERGTLGTAPGHACGWRDLRERARASDRPLPLW